MLGRQASIIGHGPVPHGLRRRPSWSLLLLCCATSLASGCKNEKDGTSVEDKEARTRFAEAKARQQLEADAEKDAAKSVAIEKLVLAWDGNSLAADREYIGKWVRTEGRVDSVFDQGGATVWLRGPNDRKVVCGGVDEDKAATLKIGAPIKIRGKVKGRLNTGAGQSPHLDPCEILETP